MVEWIDEYKKTFHKELTYYDILHYICFFVELDYSKKGRESMAKQRQIGTAMADRFVRTFGSLDATVNNGEGLGNKARKIIRWIFEAKVL